MYFGPVPALELRIVSRLPSALLADARLPMGILVIAWRLPGVKAEMPVAHDWAELWGCSSVKPLQGRKKTFNNENPVSHETKEHQDRMCSNLPTYPGPDEAGTGTGTSLQGQDTEG